MNPTPEQVEYLKRACGTRRFSYNWGREQWEKQYQAYKTEQETLPQEQRVLKPPNAFVLKKQFNEIREQEYPWTYHVTKCVVEGAFDDLKKAYDNFFAGRAEYPTYKKKGKSHESFYLSNDKFTLGSQWISIPGLGRFMLDQRQTKKDRGKLLRKLGTVNLAEKLRFVEAGKATIPTKHRARRKQVLCELVKILGATVSCEAGHWYVSIQVEIRKQRSATPTAVVGVDVGLKQAAVVSDGRRLENQRPLARHLKKLGKLQRKLSKKQQTKDPQTKRTVVSSKYEKQRLKVARKHQQIANIRRDVQHKFSTELARSCGVIGIEDLNILGMLANRKLARAVADAAMGQLLRFLKTKVENRGGDLFIARRAKKGNKVMKGNKGMTDIEMRDNELHLYNDDALALLLTPLLQLPRHLYTYISLFYGYRKYRSGYNQLDQIRTHILSYWTLPQAFLSPFQRSAHRFSAIYRRLLL